MTPRTHGSTLPRADRRSRIPSGLLVLLASALASLAVTAGAPPPALASSEAPASTTSSTTSGSVNPLAGHTWGVYQGDSDQVWQPYQHASASQQSLLGAIVDRPKAQWFGRWVPDDAIRAKAASYIAATTHGDPDVLTQMAIFRMDPWESEACRTLPSAAQQASYKDWIDQLALGIGDSRVALVLQPDGPFAQCAPHGSKLPSHLIAYAAQELSSLPNTSVYIDGGADDWLRGHAGKAARFLVADGVKYARGFALDSTHYDSTASEVEFGSRIVAALAAKGLGGKHFVVNTAENGRPFTGAWLAAHHRGADFDNAPVCLTGTQTHCVTLGIPPTTDVADPAWGLSGADERRAAAHVDGYLWFGRPWLDDQAAPFDLARALLLARTTPY